MTNQGNRFFMDVSEDEYHTDTNSISKSGLDRINRSPAHYMAYLHEPQEPTRAMVLGTAMHRLILEPHKAEELYVVAPCDDRRRAEYRQFAEHHQDYTILTPTEREWLDAMDKAVADHPAASRLLTDLGDAELSAYAKDPDTEVRVRCRYDYLIRDTGIAIDLKKCQDARPGAIAKSIAQYRYHVQAAVYGHIYELITGEPLAAMAFIFVEERPPHAVQVVTLDDQAMAQGRIEMRANLTTYRNCLDSGQWPAYGQEVATVGLPEWYLRSVYYD